MRSDVGRPDVRRSDARLSGKLRARWLAALLAAVTLAGCYDGDPSDFREVVVVGRDTVTALTITGELAVLEVGTSIRLVASATTSAGTKDLSRETTWRSSNPAAVFVDSSGRITAVANGSAQITAELAQYSDTVTITASDATLQTVTVSGDAAIDECGTGTYTASGHYDDGTDRDITTLVSWSVTDATVSRMSTLAAERNLLVSLGTGTTGVVATRSGVLSPAFGVTIADNLDAIAVTPAAPAQIPVDGTVQFTATGTRGAATADISRAAQWVVANDAGGTDLIASVLNGDVTPGLLTGRKGGAGTLTASCGGQNDAVPVTVVFLDSLAITNTRPIELKVGTSLLLVLEGTYSDNTTRPLNESATWSTSTVSGTGVTVSTTAGTRGRVTAGSDEGVSTVTATLEGKTVSVSVSVVR